MTITELKEKIGLLKNDLDSKLKEKCVYTEAVYNYVDKNLALSDEYTEESCGFTCDFHFFVEDGEESLPITLEVELDASGDAKDSAEGFFEEFKSELEDFTSCILKEEDPVGFIKKEIQKIIDAQSGKLEKLNRNANTFLIAALSVGVVLIAWIIYIIARG